MSPNHLEFDKAIQELRDESPPSDRRERARGVVLGPRRPSFKLPALVGATAVVALVLLALYPTRGNGLAWGEVVRRTEQASNLHITWLDDQGLVRGEQWRSGASWAAWARDNTGRITIENRNDRATSYNYIYRKQLTAPNATQYATLWNITPQMLEGEKQYGGPVQTVDALLNSKSAMLIRQEKAETDGRAVQRYVLTMYGEQETVDADPQTGRILFMRLKEGLTGRFEYPALLDPKIFSFKSRLTRDIPVIDRRGHDPEKDPPYMPKPIDTKDGIRLRGVSVDAGGNLSVLWTGYLPDKNTSMRLHVVGVKTGATLWLGYYKDGIHPVQGPHAKRLVSYRVELPEKIGDRVTLRIPTRSSYVEFRDVPVKRLEPLRE